MLYEAFASYFYGLMSFDKNDLNFTRHLFVKLIYVSRKRFSTGLQVENRGSGS